MVWRIEADGRTADGRASRAMFLVLRIPRLA
jgi:hypothetical protein